MSVIEGWSTGSVLSIPAPGLPAGQPPELRKFTLLGTQHSQHSFTLATAM